MTALSRRALLSGLAASAVTSIARADALSDAQLAERDLELVLTRTTAEPYDFGSATAATGSR